MIRATTVRGQYHWIDAAVDTVVLDFDDRHRRRMAMTGTRGLEFLLDLETAVALRGGDALMLEDGRLIEVVAAPEPLIEIRGTDPGHLVRLAWHLGNRHLPTQIMAKGLRIRRDHVIEEMVKGLGGRVIEIEAPFDPEGGAYAARMKPRTRMGIMAMVTTTAVAVTIITATLTASTIMRMMSIAGMITVTFMTNIVVTITGIPMLMATSKPPDASLPAEPMQLPADEGAALYRLMTWLSPSFPVGAFSYSSGIEWAVEAGDITDAASLQGWLSAMLSDGGGFCDGVFLAHIHRAAATGDDKALRDIAELASAFAPSKERLLETSTQGKAFIEISLNAWPHEMLKQLIAACDGPIVYPVAVGLVSAAHGLPLAPTMHAFFHAVVSNWISAGARLVPLGQTDSQRVLAALEPVVVATGHHAMTASLDDLGSATFRADIACMRHETQYTRLFRS